MRAAASSSASGSPSSRRQISRTCGALSSSRANSGSRARARSTEHRHRAVTLELDAERARRGIRHLERAHREQPLGGQARRLAARDHHGELRARREQLGDQRRRPRPAARSCRARAASGGRRGTSARRPPTARPHRPAPRAPARSRRRARGLEDGGERDEACTIGEVGGQARWPPRSPSGLADAAGSHQRDEATTTARRTEPSQLRDVPSRPNSAVGAAH